MNETQTTNEEGRNAARRVRRGITHLARRMRGLRVDHGISGSKLAVLGWLFRAASPMTAKGLARLERLQPQSLTRIIAELENEGLIRRTPDDADRRQVLIQITQLGQELLTKDAERQDQWLTEIMMVRMTKAERDILVVAADLLEKLALDEAEIS